MKKNFDLKFADGISAFYRNIKQKIFYENTKKIFQQASTNCKNSGKKVMLPVATEKNSKKTQLFVKDEKFSHQKIRLFLKKLELTSNDLA